MYTQSKLVYNAFDGTTFDDIAKCLNYEAERREIIKSNLFSDEAIMVVDGRGNRHYDIDFHISNGERRWIWFRSVMSFVTMLRYIAARLPDDVREQIVVSDTVHHTSMEKAKYVSNPDHAIPYVRAWHQFAFDPKSQTLYVIDSAANVGALLRMLGELSEDYAEHNDLPN